jgi:hypothetical protein
LDFYHDQIIIARASKICRVVSQKGIGEWGGVEWERCHIGPTGIGAGWEGGGVGVEDDGLVEGERLVEEEGEAVGEDEGRVGDEEEGVVEVEAAVDGWEVTALALDDATGVGTEVREAVLDDARPAEDKEGEAVTVDVGVAVVVVGVLVIALVVDEGVTGGWGVEEVERVREETEDAGVGVVELPAPVAPLACPAALGTQQLNSSSTTSERRSRDMDWRVDW